MTSQYPSVCIILTSERPPEDNSSLISFSVHNYYLWETIWGQCHLNNLQCAYFSPLIDYLKTMTSQYPSVWIILISERPPEDSNCSISFSVHSSHLWETTWGQWHLNILQCEYFSSLRDHLRTMTSQYPSVCINLTSERPPEDSNSSISFSVHNSHLWETTWGQWHLNILQCA